MTCLGVLDRGERGDDSGTSLKEGGGIEMSTTVLPYTRCTLSSLELLTMTSQRCNDSRYQSSSCIVRTQLTIVVVAPRKKIATVS